MHYLWNASLAFISQNAGMDIRTVTSPCTWSDERCQTVPFSTSLFCLMNLRGYIRHHFWQIPPICSSLQVIFMYDLSGSVTHSVSSHLNITRRPQVSGGNMSTQYQVFTLFRLNIALVSYDRLS